MKLTNKILALSLFCLSSLMAEDRKNINQVYGIDVALINIFWESFSQNRTDISVDDYIFSISEDSTSYTVNCDLNVARINSRYKKLHPDANMKYLSVKGGCGWSKISKESLEIIENKYFK